MNINQVNVNDSNNKLQQNKNSSKIIIIIMAFIIICLLGYIFYIKLNNDKENKQNNNQENNSSQTENNGTHENNEYKDFDEVVNEMKKLPSFSYKITYNVGIKEVSFAPFDFDKVYQAALSSDGKVSIKDEDNVITTLNISDVKNIECINEKLFILLKNGDLYSYSFNDFISNKNTVTKVDKIKKVETFVILYWFDCTECGGNTTLGVIDSNNKYISLDGFGM